MFFLEVNMKKLPWLGILVVFLMACGLSAPAAMATPVPGITPSPQPPHTETFTFPPVSSATPVPSTTLVPVSTATSDAGVNPLVATMLDGSPTPDLASLMAGSPLLALSGGLDAFSNPVGTPLKTWHDFPIMSQATAGQEYPGSVYSYRTAATLDQAVTFYKTHLPSSLLAGAAIATGNAGSGQNTSHDVSFMLPGTFIFITSRDQAPTDTLVVISSP
jgi:hypothetical protein